MSLLEEFNWIVERVSATEKKEEQVKEVKEVKENVKEQVKEEVKENVKEKEKKKKVKEGWKWGWEYVKTEWWWKWEWETDGDWYPIERKENDSASMYHIERNWWYWVEWTWKDEKSYKIWDITFKRTGENILAYKKNWELKVVKRVKVPFNLAQRLYETSHTC